MGKKRKDGKVKQKDPFRFLPFLKVNLTSSDTTGDMYISWERLPGHSYTKIIFLDQLKALPVRVEGKDDEIIKNRCSWVKPPEFNVAETDLLIQTFDENDKPLSKPTSSKNSALEGSLKMEIFSDRRDIRILKKSGKKTILL